MHRIPKHTKKILFPLILIPLKFLNHVPSYKQKKQADFDERHMSCYQRYIILSIELSIFFMMWITWLYDNSFFVYFLIISVLRIHDLNLEKANFYVCISLILIFELFWDGNRFKAFFLHTHSKKWQLYNTLHAVCFKIKIKICKKQ